MDIDYNFFRETKAGLNIINYGWQLASMMKIMNRQMQTAL